MQFTMKNVLELKEMECTSVLTAEHSLATRPIELVSVIEAPVDMFDRKKEFILTTGISCSHDINIFKKFVKDLIDADAEALGIATGNYILEIPAEIIQLAEEYEFPIVEIPWKIRFGHIIQAVLSQIHSYHQIQYKKSEEMQTELLRLFLDHAKISDALNVIDKNIKASIAITDYKGNIKEKGVNSCELIAQWDQYLETLSKPLSSQPFKISKYHSNKNEKWFRLEDYSYFIVSIRTGNIIQGFLLLLPDEASIESFPSKEEEQLLEYAITSLALWFQQEYSIHEAEMRLRGDFILNLAKGEVDLFDIVPPKAKSMGYDLTKPYVCILGFPKNLKNLIQQLSSDKTLYEDLMQRTILSIENQINRIGETFNQRTLITFFQDKFIIYLECSSENSKGCIHSFLDVVEEKLQILLPGIEIVWGIDDQPGVKIFHKSYNNALIALNIGRQQKDSRQRFTFSNVGLFKVILSLVDNPDMERLTSSTIGKLVDHDKQRNSDLVKTLSIYIGNQGNISQTARDLFIHRQSLLYRLQKIETLLGISFDHSDDLLTLNLCFKFWSMNIGEKIDIIE